MIEAGTGRKPRRTRKSQIKYGNLFSHYWDKVMYPWAGHINPFEEYKFQKHFQRVQKRGESLVEGSIEECHLFEELEDEGHVINIAQLAQDLFKGAKFTRANDHYLMNIATTLDDLRYEITNIKGFDYPIKMARLSLPRVSDARKNISFDERYGLIKKSLKKRDYAIHYTLSIVFPIRKSSWPSYHGLIIPLKRKHFMIPRKTRKEFGHIFRYVANERSIQDGRPKTDFHYYDVYFNKPSFERGIRDAINDLGSWGCKKND